MITLPPVCCITKTGKVIVFFGNTQRTFSSRCRTSKGLSEHNELESGNRPPTGSNEKQHLIVENGLIMCLTETVVVVQITALLFGGASAAQGLRHDCMKIQNDDRVETLILMIGTNDISRNPIPPKRNGNRCWFVLLMR